MLWHGDDTTNGVDAVVVPGGFAHGDYLRTGAIARFSPVMDAVAEFAAAGGPVVGICNGFQVLTEAQLLPGALQKNAGLKFLCETVELRVETTSTVLTNAGRGRRPCCASRSTTSRATTCATPTTLAELRADDRVVVRYVDNPNGSLDDIAGICNEGRNVVGLMPHPERASDAILGSADGVVLLRSLLAAACRRRRVTVRATYTFGDSDARARAARRSSPTCSRRRPARCSPTCRRRSAATSSTSAAVPGYTTALLRDAFPLAQSPGSTRRTRWSTRRAPVCPTRAFAVVDVTQPLRLPADVVYARLLLGHLPDPAPALATWATSLRPGSGLLVCEEPVATAATTRCSRATRRSVTAVVADDAARRCGPRPRSTTTRPAANACSTASSSIPVPAARAAAMFWRNAVQWRDRDARWRRADRALPRARAAGPTTEIVMWEMRQVAFRKRRG